MRSRFSAFWGVFSLLMMAACAAPASFDDLDSAGAGMAQLGDRMREKGEHGAAMDFYRRALSNDPANKKAITGLAASLEAWGDPKAAGDVYLEGIAARPDDADIRKSYGKLLIALDEPFAAKKQYEAALDIDGDDAKARGGLAVALDYLGEHKKAQKQYELALRDDPDNLALVNNLAYSHILSRRYDHAIGLLEPVLHDPRAGAALRQNLALAYGLSGMDADAERITRMDIPPEKVTEHMDYFRARRAEMAVGNAPYAEIGTYATEAMAIAQIKRLQPQMKKTGGDLRAVVLPEVSAPGGTPRFAVRMMGCARPSDVDRFCEILAKSGIPCVARGRGGE